MTLYRYRATDGSGRTGTLEAPPGTTAPLTIWLPVQGSTQALQFDMIPDEESDDAQESN